MVKFSRLLRGQLQVQETNRVPRFAFSHDFSLQRLHYEFGAGRAAGDEDLGDSAIEAARTVAIPASRA